MTHTPDDPYDGDPGDPPGRSEGDRKLDEDAAWRAIVENYGERPTLDEQPLPDGSDRAPGSTPGAAESTEAPQTDPSQPPSRPAPASGQPTDAPPEPPRFSVFERRWTEPEPEPEDADATADGDEEHFVPPEPPPLPKLDPRRRLAWAGLFGAPVLIIVGFMLGVVYPTWFTGMVIAAFFGGFAYLVATMPRDRPDDWSGDDGAVV